jgi:flagellar basal body-associated protein FliL
LPDTDPPPQGVRKRARELASGLIATGRRKAAWLAVIAAVVGGSGLLAAAQQNRSGPEVTVALEGVALHEFPELIVDLKDNGARPAYLRLVMLVEIPEHGQPRLETNKPLILNALRSRLRDYQRHDLVGKAGADRLRTDLLNLINGAIEPAAATDVLFKDFLLN